MNTTEATTKTESRLKVYELGYLLAPTIAEEQVAGEVESIKATLEKYEAAFITEDFPKLRPLAYTMTKDAGGKRNKFDKAYFGWVKFEAPALALPLIKEALDKNEKLVRFMAINTVRENTLISQRVVYKPPTTEDEKPKTEAPVVPINQEELDKTIDNLVVE